MRDLNIDFMDLYKRTDRFMKDAYSSSEGVSEYIRLMESCFNRGSSSVQGWKSDYDNLKHVRWIRNQLAHEVSYDSDICSSDDYEWLDGFYKRLFSTDDPLAMLRKMEIKAVSERAEKRQLENRPQQVPRAVSPSQQPMQQEPSHDSRQKKPVYYEQPMHQKTNVKQSSGCFCAFIIMLMLSVSIVILVYLLSK